MGTRSHVFEEITKQCVTGKARCAREANRVDKFGPVAADQGGKGLIPFALMIIRSRECAVQHLRKRCRIAVMQKDARFIRQGSLPLPRGQAAPVQ